MFKSSILWMVLWGFIPINAMEHSVSEGRDWADIGWATLETSNPQERNKDYAFIFDNLSSFAAVESHAKLIGIATGSKSLEPAEFYALNFPNHFQRGVAESQFMSLGLVATQRSLQQSLSKEFSEDYASGSLVFLKLNQLNWASLGQEKLFIIKKRGNDLDVESLDEAFGSRQFKSGDEFALLLSGGAYKALSDTLRKKHKLGRALEDVLESKIVEQLAIVFGIYEMFKNPSMMARYLLHKIKEDYQSVFSSEKTRQSVQRTILGVYPDMTAVLIKLNRVNVCGESQSSEPEDEAPLFLVQKQKNSGARFSRAAQSIVRSLGAVKK